MSEVISSFKSLKAGAQVFALLMLFLCVILHTMWSGKSLQFLMCRCEGKSSTQLSDLMFVIYAYYITGLIIYINLMDGLLNLIICSIHHIVCLKIFLC